ncbi:MAG TPA: ABC transporter permease [Steroidobacteraceae bacterium]|jgi:putative ABC transport system permease protein|nr:ABC transporter permease [Steroidobacteraceae bacterium]
MHALRQIGLLLRMALAGARARWGSYLVTMITVACVVGVLVAMLSMGSGMRMLAAKGARADRAVVESTGAQSTFTSNIERSAVGRIVNLPGIRRDADGRPLATATTIVQASVHKRRDDALVSIPLYAVDPAFFRVFPELHLTAGRMFRSGLDELIVPRSRSAQFKGLEIGDRIHLSGVDWSIVGTFDTGGGAWNGLIGDQNTVGAAYKRTTTQLVSVVLQNRSSFGPLRATLKADPSMDVEFEHEAQVREQDTRGLTGILDFVSYFVGVVMAVGATLGAVNVMYAIVDGRRREMATLRALGFGAGPIAAAVMLESLLLALPGALAGVALAWLFFNGNQVSPQGASFQLVITWQLALLGVGWALAMGLVGGLAPSLRAGRVPVATALRAA